MFAPARQDLFAIVTEGGAGPDSWQTKAVIKYSNVFCWYLNFNTFFFLNMCMYVCKTCIELMCV